MRQWFPSMSSRDVLKLLFDVERACVLAIKFTRDRTFEAFLEDELLQSAVERQSEIIGEALRQAVDLDPSLSDRLPDTRRIIAFRNRLVHGSDVSLPIVWRIVNRDVPKLLDEVRAILAESS